MIKQLKNFISKNKLLVGIGIFATILLYPRKAKATIDPAILERVKQYDTIINSVSATYKVDPKLIKAIIIKESQGVANALSPVGAKGLMQLMDTTATWLGVKSIYDPTQNITGGTKYMRILLDIFKGDIKLALAGYNAGQGNVLKYGGIPPFPETQKYVADVLAYRDAL